MCYIQREVDTKKMQVLNNYLYIKMPFKDKADCRTCISVV